MPDILTAFGLSASAGLNAYIPLLMIAVAARLDLIQLQSPFNLLATGWAIAVLAILLVVEVLADKFPLVDHANDMLMLFIRPAAGAVLFAASTGTVDSMNPTLAIVLGILVAGSTHAAKATARPMVTASTGGIGNPIVSTIEDVAAFVTSLVAIVAPLLIGIAVLVFAVFVLGWLNRRGGRTANARSG